MHARRRAVAVVGHVEWVQFARVAELPRGGEVAHAYDTFEEPAGGGAVAAVQLSRLAGSALLVTALGDDDRGRRSQDRLRGLGVDVRAAPRAPPTRTAMSLSEDSGERAIVTFGQRLEPERGDGELPWDELASAGAIYFTAGDLGALRAARRAGVLVASPRAGDALRHGVELDALVFSADDPLERRLAQRVGDEPKVVVQTAGARGGRYRVRGGDSGTWAALPLPSGALDSYGAGDSFAAGLTWALGAGASLPEAIELGARCGAVCATGRGPYERQLTASEL